MSKKMNAVFNENWTEKDEALCYDLMKRKLYDLRIEIRNSTSPFVTARLKAKVKEYKELISKIERGSYNSSILALEMAAYKQQQDVQKKQREIPSKKGSKYVDSFSEIDFDFDTYFRKSRYFGAALPFFLLLITVVLLASLLMSVVMPTENMRNLNKTVSDATSESIALSPMFYFRLDSDHDFVVENNGNWPDGKFTNPESAIAHGVLYKDIDDNIPDTVQLHAHLGMEFIAVSSLDVLKAFFFTPIMQQEYELSFAERYLFNNPEDAITWYNRFFIENRKDQISFNKDDEGNYDLLSVYNTIGTYGTIFCYVITVILLIIQLIVCIFRLFTYTSRRLHLLPIFIFIFLLLTIILPVFANTESTSFSELTKEMGEYFTFNQEKILSNASSITVNLLYLILPILMVVTVILPKLFKNRTLKQITFVPKGNKPHTYPGHKYPTKPGGIPQGYMNPRYVNVKKN